MYGQTFDPQDIATVALLVVLEGVLSIDNALVLALLAKRLPKHQQARALTYGLVGAFVFRFMAIGAAAYLLQWRIVKVLGGGYLIWVALKHLIFDKHHREDKQVTIGADDQPTLVEESTGRELPLAEQKEALKARTSLPVPEVAYAGFWSTVLMIELTDIAFAVDSILAAIAVVGSVPPGHQGPHPKFWVVLTGGILGLVLMRVAATVFIKLLEKFPKFEVSAYLLVFIIGSKLIIDWALNTPEHPHRANFHDPGAPAFWIFWGLMAACIAYGFIKPAKREPEEART